MEPKKPLQSKTIQTSIVQLISAMLIAVLAFMQGADTGKIVTNALGPEGVALAIAGLLAIKSFWDIWVRFNTSKPIG